MKEDAFRSIIWLYQLLGVYLFSVFCIFCIGAYCKNRVLKKMNKKRISDNFGKDTKLF